MILGVVGLGLMVFLTYHCITARVLTLTDVTQFRGTVKEARESRGKNGYVEILLEDQPLPFRCFSSLYPRAFDRQLLSKLGPRAPVALGVATSEVSSPRKNWLQGQQFHEFITMSIDGHDALAIGAYNENIESERKFGRWFFPLMALVSVWCIYIGYRHRHSDLPITQILKKKP